MNCIGVVEGSNDIAPPLRRLPQRLRGIFAWISHGLLKNMKQWMLNPSGIIENVGDAIMELLPSRAEPSLRLRRSRIARWLIFGLGLILGLALGLSIATIR